ncbi:MAG: DoxX family protein [Balneolales bacterium]
MNQTDLKKNYDLALLLLRIGVGLIFVVAGWGKLNGIEGVAGFFGGLGIPLPGIMAWVVACVEFFGGLMVLTGTYTRYAAPFLAFVMLTALLTTKLGGEFSAARLDLMLLLTASALIILGSGKYSVDSMVLDKRGASV